MSFSRKAFSSFDFYAQTKDLFSWLEKKENARYDRILASQAGDISRPDTVARHLSRWISIEDKNPWSSDVAFQALIHVFDCSDFLSRYFLRFPSEFSLVLAPSNEILKRPATSPEDLRKKKHHFLASLLLERVSGRISIVDELKRLSTHADINLNDAFHWTLHEMEVCPFVLALGKLGAEELNLSSDVDLVLFSHDHLTDDREYRKIQRAAEYFSRVLSEITDLGFLHRTDYRLRPMGNQSPMVQSLQSIENYLTQRGRTWERAVWLRSRLVTHHEQSQKHLDEFMPTFLFRRSIGYGTIDDLREMKARIDATSKENSVHEFDIKIGVGGIREVEFIGQAFQLIFGGKFSFLQTRSTIEVLDELVNLPTQLPEKVEELKDAYLQFRSVENALQWDEDQQTHRLPSFSDEKKWKRIQKMIPEFDDIRARVQKSLSSVHSIFEEIFTPERRKSTPLYWDRPWDTSQPSNDLRMSLGVEERISESDFHELFSSLANRIQTLRLSSKAERHLRRLIPVFFRSIVNVANPKKSLHQFLLFLERNRARSTFFLMLAENPKMLETLLQLFGASEFLSLHLIRHPEILDPLLLKVHEGTHHFHKILIDLEKEVQCGKISKEIFWDELRSVKHEELIRVALDDLTERVTSIQTTERLTQIAQDILETSFQTVFLNEDDWKARLAIVGFGSLGSGEFTYSSDLDLVFLLDLKPTEEIPEKVFRLIQRLISALSVPTQAGILYNVDTRLRPSGNQGLLVSTFHGFEKYQLTQAQIWEKHALLRARSLSRENHLNHKVDAIRNRVCFSTAKDFRPELQLMRKKLKEQRATHDTDHFDIRFGEGGLADIEFLLAHFQFMFGSEDPRLRAPRIYDLLNALEGLHWMPSSDGTELRSSYLFLKQIENRLRLITSKSTPQLAKSEETLRSLANSFSLSPNQGRVNGFWLREKIDKTLVTIHNIYRRYMEV